MPVPVPPAPNERVRGPALDRPLLHLAARGRDLQEDPRMGVGEHHLDHLTLELHRLIDVELGRKRVVRKRRCNGDRERRGKRGASE